MRPAGAPSLDDAAPLGAGIGQAFEVAAGELGMCTAAWLFVREIRAAGGPALVAALRDRLGRDFPVLDSVAAAALAGAEGPNIDPAGVVAACAGATQLVVVGLETAFLDALVPRLPDLRIALVTQGELPADWERVVGNYGGRVEPTGLASFQALAGRRSVLLTFAYGVRGHAAHVPAAWLRVIGADTRTQFRGIVAWDVLHEPMYVYPRWLVEAPAVDFSHVVG